MELGDIVKNRRRELGITQNQLANKICTQALISRIEHNDIIPKKEILNKIEERLQLKDNELTLVVRFKSNQHKIDELTAEIREYLIKREYKAIELLLNYHESLIQSSNDINNISFFKWIEASLAHQLHNDSDEALRTMDSIPLDKLENELSIEIINAIGIIYYQNNDFDSAMSYFNQGMEKINSSVHYKVQAKLLFNYALVLEESEQNKETLSILLSAIDLLTENDSLYLLGDFYYMKGFIFNKLNSFHEARDNFELAQAIFKIQNNNRFYDLSQMAISEINNEIYIKEE